MSLEDLEKEILKSNNLLNRCVAFATIKVEGLFTHQNFNTYISYRLKDTFKYFSKQAIYNWADIGSFYLKYKSYLNEIKFNAELDNLNSLIVAKKAIGKSEDEKKIRKIISDIPEYPYALYKKKYALSLELEDDVYRNYSKIDEFKHQFVIHDSTVYRKEDATYSTPIITFNRTLWKDVEYRVVARKLLDALVKFYIPSIREAKEKSRLIKENATKLPSKKLKLKL